MTPANFTLKVRPDEQLKLVRTQLDVLTTKVDLVLKSLGPAQVQIGQIRIPKPSPNLRVGWPTAVAATINAPSTGELDPEKVASVFEPITEHDALVNAVVDGRITANRILLQSPGSDPQKHRARYAAYLEITNKTAVTLDLEVPKGQVFENAALERRIQNLVVAESVTISCAPGESVSKTIPAFCLNSKLSPPDGHEGNVTPLKVKFTFNSQQSVWDRVSEAQV